MTTLSWGAYPKHQQIVREVNWTDEVQPTVAELGNKHDSVLYFGNGRSYGDSCLAISDHVISSRSRDHILAADWQQGVVRVESGMLLGELLESCVPRGWFCPVVPGTRFVTIGGAVANDIHGKNHHIRGCFGHHVRALSLIRSDGNSFVCTADQEPDWFSATIGGLGLTGYISWVEIQLQPIPTSELIVTTQRFNSLGEFFELSAQHDNSHEFSVSWVDCASRGHRLGRGVYMYADFAADGNLEKPSKNPRITLPFTSPLPVVNNLTVKAFNALYWRRAPRNPTSQRVAAERFFFPLDNIANWNRIYGPRGFQQYQAVLPQTTAQSVLSEMLSAIEKQKTGSFLAVLKCFGDIPSRGLLSFPMPGVTLALDFPQSPILTESLFPVLDKLVAEAGGRLYPAKDAHMSAEFFKSAYPDWVRIEQMRDPKINSRFWKRVTA